MEENVVKEIWKVGRNYVLLTCTGKTCRQRQLAKGESLRCHDISHSY